MSRRTTVYDVAERAGVSIATVSFAFRQPDRVRPATRDAVLQAARELGYVPSANARGLAHGRTGAFGLYAFDLMLGGPTVVDDSLTDLPEGTTSDPLLFPLYVDEVEHGFALECRARSRALLIASGAPSDRAVYDIAGRVDGLAIFPGPHRLEAMHTIAQNIPVVAFNTPGDNVPFSQVAVDNREGIGVLAEHLVTVHGITDIGFVGDGNGYDFHERFVALDETLTALGVEHTVDAEHVGLAGRQWRDALAHLIATDRLPRALVCQNDQHALEALEMLRTAGVDVPGRVAVTGFDGILAGSLSTPTLTTIRQPLEPMGRLAVRLLTAHVNGTITAPQRHVLPLTPLFRGSCGC